MNYKDLLDSTETPYKIENRYYYKNSSLNRRYYSNFLSYHMMPNQEVFLADLKMITEEQRDYPEPFVFIKFPEKEEIPEEVLDLLKQRQFQLEKHIIFTNKRQNLHFSESKDSQVTVKPLEIEDKDSFINYKYQSDIAFGKGFADMMKKWR
ncbi:hypothetical protein HMPREF9318_00571 [Streptococcus urinalis FB127-CNA-2]|uniref:Acetyltransferase, GNAT family n=1 Tax=Streptococcus urinalis 2285-97 TaxID=764291 RepID=G5KGK5_9STRE|nr:DUF5613 domain-containing protein [Streptococcus urinalis]EHJ57655.1 acetyltransferase, GNAT family [Streptococcus urinalis 2285-97]EKS22373.1 hypothetical protein HMPREF9318_00571 [Streptococcus urinalis FB127-CNA-2]VEF32186.1 acetyltransferase (GNAT) family protein [Streptococcus urinalis]